MIQLTNLAAFEMKVAGLKHTMIHDRDRDIDWKRSTAEGPGAIGGEKKLRTASAASRNGAVWGS